MDQSPFFTRFSLHKRKSARCFTFGVFLFKNIVSLAAEREDDIFSTPDGVCFLGILFQGSGVELRLWPGSFLMESLYIFKVSKGASG
jgi:hypothetical protein